MRAVAPREEIARILGVDPADLTVQVKIDLNDYSFGGDIEGALDLQKVAEKLGGAIAWVFEWMPDIEFDSIGFAYDPSTHDFALYGTGGAPHAKHPSATLTLGFVPNANGPPAQSRVAAIDLDIGVDLGGLPVLGSMLDGISLGPFGVSYATGDVAKGALKLPGNATESPAYKSGLTLGLTATGPGASMPLTYNTAFGGSKTQRLSAMAVHPARSGEAAALPVRAATAPVGPGTPGTAALLWFDVHKSLGPLTIGRIGIESDEQRVGLALDATLSLDVLELGLRGFEVAFPKSAPSDVHISVDGLDVEVNAPSLSIQGGLVREGEDSYEGAVVIEVGEFSIAAVGAFGKDPAGGVSMFVFGVAGGPFGGPPAFYVTGLAAGFGFNRGLRLPAPTEVQQFPFVAMADKPPGQAPDTATVLATLDSGGWVPPQHGNYWIAAGVKATSFELADSFVLFIVEFGSDLVFALLGTSTIKLPQEGTPYAQATMTLDAVLRPAEGTLQVTALLTPDSWVIDRDCHLTGGFAFFLWFGGNEHHGDFVITIGGYNHNFTKPNWYPDIPRLGFDWQMSSEIELKGEAYFALTPSCVMAGGALSLTFQDGDLSAWFDAYADFIIWWKPFYYDIEIGISIGASYRMSVLGIHKTFTIELSADVELWGPPLAGVAHVKWFIISFTVNINGGGSPQLPGTAVPDWKTFADTFLPAAQQQPKAQNRVAALEAPGPPAVDATKAVCTLRAAGGLLGTVGDTWLMQSHGLQLACETAIPATQITIATNGPTLAGSPAAVYPMGSVPIKTSVYAITVAYEDGVELDVSGWSWQPVPQNLAQALWGTENNGSPPLSAGTIPGVVGVTGTPPEEQPSGPLPFDVSVIEWTEIPDGWLPLAADDPVSGAVAPASGDTRTAVAATIATQAAARSQIVAALDAAYADGGALAKSDDDMSEMAKRVDAAYQAGPTLGPLGTNGVTSQYAEAAPAGHLAAARRVRRVRRPQPPAPLTRLRPRAAFRRRPLPGPDTHVAGGPDALRAPRARLDGHVADRLSGTHQRAALHALLDSAGQAHMEPGTTLVWDVHPDAVLSLVTDGALHLRVTAVGRGGWLLGDDVLPAGEETLSPIPPGTTRVALTSSAADFDASVSGWHGSSPLVQLGPRAFLADGATIRPQALQRIPGPRRRGTREVGVTTGRDLVDRGWVDAPDGPRRGFVETALGGDARSVVVTVRRDGDLSAPAADRVSMAAARGDDDAHAELALESELVTGDVAHLVYTAGGDPEAGPLRTVAHIGDGWALDGVLGFATEPADVFEAGVEPLRFPAIANGADARAAAVALQ